MQTETDRHSLLKYFQLNSKRLENRETETDRQTDTHTQPGNKWKVGEIAKLFSGESSICLHKCTRELNKMGGSLYIVHNLNDVGCVCSAAAN
jgi:hypothetical protein